MGSVYKRGRKYYIGYAQDGRWIRESVKTDDREVAERLLKVREAEIAIGREPAIYYDRIKLNHLIDDLLMDYEIKGNRSLERVRISVKHLWQHFGDCKVVSITGDAITRYIKDRQDEGAANGTINRELAALRRLFNLALYNRKLSVEHIPHIELLEEAEPKEGFFEDETFRKLYNLLPDYVQPVVMLAFKRGLRIKECLNLTWREVDFKNECIRLRPGHTKNKKGRVIPLDSESIEILKRQNIRHIDYVFHHNGKQIKDFRHAWNRACDSIGLNGYKITKVVKKEKKLIFWVDGREQRTFHDFRRTAARNMFRSGLSVDIAKEITGHKTDAMFRRYNIITEGDVLEAGKRLKDDRVILPKNHPIGGKIEEQKTG